MSLSIFGPLGNKAYFGDFSIFRDFFKSYVSNPKMIIMFFEAIGWVVSVLKGFYDDTL